MKIKPLQLRSGMTLLSFTLRWSSNSFLYPDWNFALVRADVQSLSCYPRVNVPELTGVPFTPAIFWFGKVDQTNNYADVRVWYYDPYY